MAEIDLTGALSVVASGVIPVSLGPEPSPTDAFRSFLTACAWFGISYQLLEIKAHHFLAKS